MPMTNTTPTPSSYQFYKDVEWLASAHWDAIQMAGGFSAPKPPTSINARRGWWFREYQRYPSKAVVVRYVSKYDTTCEQHVYTSIHAAIFEALDRFGPAHGGHCLLLELPHQSIKSDDPLQIAYTPNDKYGEADRQVVTTLGKYLRRNWPNIPDHAIRDLVARFAAPEMELWTSKEKIIMGVELGPRSCMKSTYGNIPFREYDRHILVKWLENNNNNPEPEWDRHPYAVYDPALGWGMAVMVRKGNGTKVPEVTDRCLTYTDPDDPNTKVFVRSYKRGKSEESTSYTSEALESRLKDMGYAKRSRWPAGAELLRLEHPRSSGPLLPYLDGADSVARWVEDTGERIFKIDCEEDANSDSTPLCCDCTDGTGTENNRHTWTCPSCGEGQTDYDHEDSLSIGRYDDENVCRSCSDGYVEVRGSVRNGYRQDMERGYAEYYIPECEAREVLNCSYSIDPDIPPDNVVELEDGDYAELEDTVCISGDYYMYGDRRIVELAEESPDGDMYALKCDAWEDGDGDWHHDDYEYITYDGDKWLKDDAWQCEATGWWYPNHIDCDVDPLTGDTVHPDFLEECNRDADFIIVYSEDVTNTPANVLVNTGETLMSDRYTAAVYA